MTREEIYNKQLQHLKEHEFLSVGKISDGYHTFDELYECRNVLWVALVKALEGIQQILEQVGMEIDNRRVAWRSRCHSDGSAYAGWFLLGLGTKAGEQMTFHLPDEFWSACEAFATTLDKAPEFDGHTTKDVLERITKF